MIQEEFLHAVNSYTAVGEAGNVLWKEIELRYGEKSRHYHTMTHIEDLLFQLIPVKGLFRNWHVVVFAIVYHDIIYKASRTNNEDKSAELAVERLNSIVFPSDLIERCREFILATKRHEPVDREIDLFTDADLAILGSDPNSYQLYARQIRKEFAIYPDFVYKSGRKKVLLHFLQMPYVYKTIYFRDKYEVAARRNLEDELAMG